MQMNYKEKKRSMFFGLPWTFTSYTVTEEIITVDTGLFKKEENDCYLYKVIDVRLESTLLERMLSLIHIYHSDSAFLYSGILLFFQVFICCGEHQFDSIQLIYFTGTWIVVDGNDIGHRILVTQFFDDTFADYVVR